MSTSSNSSLKVLYTRRSSMKGQITKFKNYVDKINKSIDEITDLELVELNLKLSKIECLSTRFDNLQTEIEVLNSENLLAEIDERELIEDSLIQSQYSRLPVVHPWRSRELIVEPYVQQWKMLR
ncbi:hypothetical protein ACJJTC_000890 [Scirpophaga incertulas]